MKTLGLVVAVLCETAHSSSSVEGKIAFWERGFHEGSLSEAESAELLIYSKLAMKLFKPDAQEEISPTDHSHVEIERPRSIVPERKALDFALSWLSHQQKPVEVIIERAEDKAIKEALANF